jgi:hypothetical protein
MEKKTFLICDFDCFHWFPDWGRLAKKSGDAPEPGEWIFCFGPIHVVRYSIDGHRRTRWENGARGV